MIVKQIKIGPARIKWVFRHIWEKDKSISNYEVWKMKKRPEIGIWFERHRVIGPVKKGENVNKTIKNTFSENNLVNEYMIRLKLIIFYTWITLRFKPILEL